MTDFGAPGPLQDFKVAAFRLPTWDPEKSEGFLSKVGAQTAILSFPLLFAFTDEKGVAISRQVNDYAAKLRDSQPARFGFFAAIPSLNNPQAAIEEIEYALGTLKADGVVLLAKYGDAYLGHPSFEPVWEALNAHQAVVFVHPGTTFRSNMFNKYIDPAIAEFVHETTNTALDMIMNNTVRKHSDCKIILSHAGGTLPYLIGRAAALAPAFAAAVDPPPKPSNEIVEDAKSFYFDVALSSSPYVLDSLLRNFPQDHILYGSDFLFTPPPVTLAFAQALDGYELTPDARQRIYAQNAIALLPRLAAALHEGDIADASGEAAKEP